MASFIFLHGSFHAAWNWHKVLPLLERAGHRAIALDLPAHGHDQTPAHRASLDACVNSIQRALDRLKTQAVLVAHSRNGIVISQAAERFPDRIAGLVYLAAYLVPHGRSMMDYAIEDRESLVVQNVIPRISFTRAKRLVQLFKHPIVRAVLPHMLPRRFQSHRLDAAVYKEALYQDCDASIVELAHALLEPEPNWPGFTPLQLSAERYGKTPKVYIECLQDRAVTLQLQRKMQLDTPCNRVFSLDSGHSPFFSQPQELTQALIDSLAVFAAASEPVAGPA